jgi:hypothetical protein
VTHASRDALRRTLDPDEAAVARVVAALADLAGGSDPPEGDGDASWLCELVERHLVDGTAPTDREVARLLRALLDPSLCAMAWLPCDRPVTQQHVELWRAVLRRSPRLLAAAPAALLALTAWQAGDGALAWCAVDRCAEVEPDHPIVRAVARALTCALPPEAWPGVWRDIWCPA